MVKPFDVDTEKVDVGNWKSNFNGNCTRPENIASAKEFANAWKKKLSLIKLTLSEATSDPKQNRSSKESPNLATNS